MGPSDGIRTTAETEAGLGRRARSVVYNDQRGARIIAKFSKVYGRE